MSKMKTETNYTDDPILRALADACREFQRDVSEFVGREVIYNVSTLVNELIEHDVGVGKLYTVCSQDDWLTPAIEETYNLSRDECVEILESIGIACQDDEPIENLRAAIFDESVVDGDIDAQDFCDSRGLDPYQRKACEHWIVSDWLANRLEERGEMVLRDFMGLTIWGRTTTGQSVSFDLVICGIYEAMKHVTGV